jgi:hypothetical protein
MFLLNVGIQPKYNTTQHRRPPSKHIMETVAGHVNLLTNKKSVYCKKKTSTCSCLSSNLVSENEVM